MYIHKLLNESICRCSTPLLLKGIPQGGRTRNMLYGHVTPGRATVASQHILRTPDHGHHGDQGKHPGSRRGTFDRYHGAALGHRILLLVGLLAWSPRGPWRWRRRAERCHRVVDRQLGSVCQRLGWYNQRCWLSLTINCGLFIVVSQAVNHESFIHWPSNHHPFMNQLTINEPSYVVMIKQGASLCSCNPRPRLDDSFQCPYHFPAMLLLAQLFALVAGYAAWGCPWKRVASFFNPTRSKSVVWSGAFLWTYTIFQVEFMDRNPHWIAWMALQESGLYVASCETNAEANRLEWENSVFCGSLRAVGRNQGHGFLGGHQHSDMGTIY